MRTYRIYFYWLINVFIVFILQFLFLLQGNATDVNVSSKKPTKIGVNLGDSNVVDDTVRNLTVNTEKSVLTKVNPVSNDPASYWEVGGWVPNESTQVTFTGRQRKNQESKKYTPKFSGSAKNTNGSRGGDPNYDWNVEGTYKLTNCNDKCYSGAKTEVPVDYDLSVDRRGIKPIFESKLHRETNCNKTPKHPDHVINWDAIQIPSDPNEITVSCNKGCNIGTIKVVPGEYEIVVTAEDDFTGRSNSMFGLGEVGYVTVINKEDGEEVDIDNVTIQGNPNTLQKDDRIDAKSWKIRALWLPGSGTIQAVVKGKTITYQLEIIEPEGVYQILKQNSQWSEYPTRVGGGFYAYSFLLPTEVSFRALLVTEGNCDATNNRRGIWQDFIPHKMNEQWPNGPVSVSGGNKTNGCRVEGPNVDYSDGIHFYCPRKIPESGDILWSIPWGYIYPGRPVVFFDTLNQGADTNPASGTEIFKENIRIRANKNGSVKVISEGGK